MSRRALVSAATAAAILFAIGLYLGDDLGTASAAPSADSEQDDQVNPSREPITSSTRPQSGTGGRVVWLPPPFNAPDVSGDDSQNSGDQGSGENPSGADPGASETPGEQPGGPTDDPGGSPHSRPTDVIGNLIWAGDFETGDLSQFASTPWNAVGSPGPEIVSDGRFVREGKHALKITIPGGGNRNEVVPPNNTLRPGDDRYFGYSTLLGDGFPINASWQSITQWKNDGTGSPPLSMMVEDGQYVMRGGFGHPGGNKSFSVPVAPAVTGKWVDWTVHIKFSPNPNEGYFEIWMNGDLVVPRHYPGSGTLYPGLNSYVKTGYYRNPSISQPGTIYYDSWRIGTTRTGATSGGG